MCDYHAFLASPTPKCMYFFAQTGSKILFITYSLFKSSHILTTLAKICSYLLHKISNHKILLGGGTLFD